MQLHHGGGQPGNGMPGKVGGLRGQRPFHQFYPQGLYRRPVHRDGGGILLAVPLHQAGPHLRGVGQTEVD